MSIIKQLIYRTLWGMMYFLLLPLQGAPDVPIAMQGQIDLRRWDFDSQGVVDLRGEWKFYWRQLIYEDDFPEANRADVTGYIDLPSVWNDKKVDDKKLSAEGYATFRLNVLLDKNKIPRAGLRIKTMGTACTIFINGKKIYQAGEVGRHANQTTPAYLPAVADFVPDSDQLDIVVQVANFDHRLGGVWYPITFGREQDVRAMRETSLIFNVVILGAITVMGIYHLGLFYLRRRTLGALYFSFICLLVNIRTLSTDEYLIHYFIQDWTWMIKLEFLSFYLVVPAMAHFIQALFPHEFSPNVLRAITGIGLFFSGLVLFFPPAMFTHTVGIYQVISILIGVYLVAVIWMAIRHKRQGGKTFLFGILLIFSLFVNDILYSMQWIDTAHLAPLGMLFFIASQSLTLASQFTLALHQSEELARKMNYTNQHLEEIVRERTQSLEKINEKLAQNQHKLEYKNRELLLQQDEITTQSEEIRKAGQEILIKNSKLEQQKEKLTTALDELKKAQTRLIHSEKMASLGQLTAGVAHEVNNPINFVKSGAEVLQSLCDDLIEITDKYAAIDEAQTPEELEKIRKEVKKLKLIINYDELKDDIRQMLKTVLNGAVRTMKIVEGLRTFSRLDEAHLKMIQLHENLDITLNLLRGEYETRIRIIKDYDIRVTKIECYPAQLNQVIMNLMLNAIQSIKNIGTITIQTEHETDDFVLIRIKDTGTGIPKVLQSRVFDPFFTYGKTGSTGLGLAISHSIIEEHRGEIQIQSQEAKGTTVTLRLPTTQFGSQHESTIIKHP